MLDVFTGGRAARLVGLGRPASARRLAGGAFVMGAASGLVAAPCGAPAFAAVLTFVAATGSAVLGFMYLLAFSLGLTALLVGRGPLQRGRHGAAASWALDPLGQAGRRRAAARHGRVLPRQDGGCAVRVGWLPRRCLLLALGAAPARPRKPGIAVGARAPAVVVKDLDGKPVDLATYIGGSRCCSSSGPPGASVCEALLPKVRAAHAEFGDRVEFFGVNVTVNQTPERVRRTGREHSRRSARCTTTRASSTRAYEAPTTSYIVIIDRAGKVAYTGTGAGQDLAAALRAVTAQ